jgi:hypothetical protein
MRRLNKREGNMRSHLRWTMFDGIGTIALLATALVVIAQTSPNLVTNGDFENGNTGFTTGYTIGDVSNPGGTQSAPIPRRRPELLEIGVTAATIRRERER